MATSKPRRVDDAPAATPSETQTIGAASAGEAGRTQIMGEASTAGKDPTATQATSARTVAGSRPQPKKGAPRKTSTLGDFKLLKKLGQGGMGAVYKAHQISLDRPCALKVLSRELAGKPDFVTRFKLEARSMAKIDHPNVVKCYAVDEAQGMHFVAMEFIEGRSLQDWLDELGRISVPDTIHVALQCADALQYAHAVNMVHRDIKPDNILITSKGQVKIADFGLAKVLDDNMSMTQSGTGLGTPHYMPPEQARNAKYVDQRSDIYALGGTMYHCVTGQTPFSGESVLELITAKERGSFTSAKRINPEVPERLDLMLDKAMAKDQKHRYQDIGEFIRDLESLKIVALSLSFIDAADKVVISRAADAVSAQKATRGGFSALTQPPGAGATALLSSAADAARAAPRHNMQREWFIRYTNDMGQMQVSKLTTIQIIKGLKHDVFDVTARVARERDGDYVPLAQVPEFESDAHKLATRTRLKSRNQSLAATYAQLDKQYSRQKWWRMISRFKDGTLGFVGLVLYLVIVVAVLGALGWGAYLLWQIIAQKYGLS
jgi:eukaryotic-like serine/threonine-protein kinase